MDPSLYPTARGGLSLHELLLELEDDEPEKASIYLIPPDDGALTDEDSDKSDDEHEANPNPLGAAILRTECEAVIYTRRPAEYDSEDDLPLFHFKVFASTVLRDLRNLHMNDNSKIDKDDRLYKLRSVIGRLNKNYRKYGGLAEKLSIDENMIPYYGKRYAKQFIRGKPIRFGFKNWALCTSNGYLLAFDSENME
ncbi:piggyBac transposable element-derived protein 2-like [Anthonomus grandis grandis]|uniref:piggyBac transposable element-derived protein 2-like n=1 Tax=Anthonomus grandis grandis TaxID=2921223 RepID=UPI002165D040|nr:piggyBac transposable element-derived protein 2-like [Anthonomus grandis grandis]